MRRLLLISGLLLLSVRASLAAESHEDRFVRIYYLIQQADQSMEQGRADDSRSKYLEAQDGLRSLQKDNAAWYPDVISFRLRYVAEKLATLPPADGAVPAEIPARTPGVRVPTDGGAEQTRLLEIQVRQLTGDKELLEARLREALSAQPAAVDPRELAKANEHIESLQKEVAVLRVRLQKIEAEPGRPNDTVSREELKHALTAANEKLAEQTALVANLSLEKEALRHRLIGLGDGTEAGMLTAENAALRRQLAALSSTNGFAADTDDSRLRFISLEADLKAQKLRNEALQTEKAILEDRLVRLAASRDAEFAAKTGALQRELSDARTANQTNAALISALQTALRALQDERAGRERQRRDLEKQLADTQAALTSTRSAGTSGVGVPSAEVERLTKQATALRAKLDVIEARSVPYSEHELALLKAPAPDSSRASSGASDASESKSGEPNAAALADLAAAQIGQDRLTGAETTLKRALALDPRHAPSLMLLGIVQVRQKKFDAALDALSLAAQLDPENGDTFQYLGVTLAEKGLRGPAESAFRRAIQLSPGKPLAHHNLALIYATKQPPAVELARWHYQKAIEAGDAKDPELEKLLDRRAIPAR